MRTFAATELMSGMLWNADIPELHLVDLNWAACRQPANGVPPPEIGQLANDAVTEARRDASSFDLALSGLSSSQSAFGELRS